MGSSKEIWNISHIRMSKLDIARVQETQNDRTDSFRINGYVIFSGINNIGNGNRQNFSANNHKGGVDIAIKECHFCNVINIIRH